MNVRCRSRFLILIALLLFAQLALAVHQEDIAAHAAGDTCEWCVAAAPLGAAMPSVGLAVVVPGIAPTPFVSGSTFYHRSFSAVRSRGPPTLA